MLERRHLMIKLGWFHTVKLNRLIYTTTYLIVECGGYLARQ